MNYIEAIQHAIKEGYSCSSTHVQTVPINEKHQGQTIWEGEVEVFEIKGHEKAKRCYGWGYEDRPGHTEFVTVLEVPPVENPLTAVRAYLASQFNK